MAPLITINPSRNNTFSIALLRALPASLREVASDLSRASSSSTDLMNDCGPAAAHDGPE